MNFKGLSQIIPSDSALMLVYLGSQVIYQVTEQVWV